MEAVQGVRMIVGCRLRETFGMMGRDSQKQVGLVDGVLGLSLGCPRSELKVGGQDT